MDSLLKSNTSKTRTHSLFRQGCMLYELIPNMPEHRLMPLMRNSQGPCPVQTFFHPLLQPLNEGMAELPVCIQNCPSH
jgi:hypothetical protein